jgi:hypothetical protein
VLKTSLALKLSGSPDTTWSRPGTRPDIGGAIVGSLAFVTVAAVADAITVETRQASSPRMTGLDTLPVGDSSTPNVHAEPKTTKHMPKGSSDLRGLPNALPSVSSSSKATRLQANPEDGFC